MDTEGVMLNVGETCLVRLIGPRVEAGEAFDVLDERMHGGRTSGILIRNLPEERILAIMEGMGEKGLVRYEGVRGWYSFTEFGKACWQAIADKFAPEAKNGPTYRGARGVPTGRTRESEVENLG